MQPYYSEPGMTIYHGDCREVLPTLAGESIDVILTDPPFFMPATHYQTRIRQQRTWGDTSVLATFWAVVLDLAIPCLQPTGHFLTFCHGESYPVFYPEMYRRFDALACLVWDKMHFGMGHIWRRQHELIIAARWDSSAVYAGANSWADVIRVKPTPSALRDHPVEKPIPLLARLMEPITPPHGRVLDMFIGSGSTLEAGRSLGYEMIGIDIEERSCEIAVNRMRQGVLDLAIGT